MLALLLPLNALFFYNGLGRPVYTPSRLKDYNVTELIKPGNWPVGSGLAVNINTWEVLKLNGTATHSFDPPLFVTGQQCYPATSAEYALLGRLHAVGNVSEDFPRQAYCDSLLGTMMADSFAAPTTPNKKTWDQDADKWDEAFEFCVRLFSSLAGVVADQSEGVNTMMSMVGLSFLKDMTDVFDMFMLTFADVNQMHEGRPLLRKNYGLAGYEWSFHDLIEAWIGLGVCVVLLRALAIIGFTPFAKILRRACCPLSEAELRKSIDSFFSIMFIDLPYFTLRWTSWWHYGLPVSVMAVKNVLGIYESLYFLGIVQGFGSNEPRGVRLCCLRRRGGIDGTKADLESI